MTITFHTTPPPIEETLQFEAVYEESLRLDAEDKAAELQHGLNLWLRVDGKLAGEIYAMLCCDDTEELPDIEDLLNSLYLSSVTILPEFQGRGLGRILLAHFFGMCRMRFPEAVWHSTSEGMTKLSDFFGAEKGAVHENWFDSGRTATFRRLAL